MRKKVHFLSLEEEATHLLEEARMIIPGIQAILGFQLIAVFNDNFAERLPKEYQIFHFAGALFMAIALGLLMTPAAFHRLAEPRKITRFFVTQAGRLLTGGLVFLSLGLADDLFLIGYIVMENTTVAAIMAIATLCFLFSIWFLIPILFRQSHSSFIQTEDTAADPAETRLYPPSS